jgi:hypothetical protein
MGTATEDSSFCESMMGDGYEDREEGSLKDQRRKHSKEGYRQ